jgi:hypothetical protein
MENSAYVRAHSKRRQNAKTAVAIMAGTVFVGGLMSVGMYLYTPTVVFLSSGQTYAYESNGNGFWCSSLFIMGGVVVEDIRSATAYACTSQSSLRPIAPNVPHDVRYEYAAPAKVDVTFAWTRRSTTAPRIELWNDTDSRVLATDAWKGQIPWTGPPSTHIIRMLAASATTINITLDYTFAVGVTNQTRVPVPWSHDRPRVVVSGPLPPNGMCEVDRPVRIYPEPRALLVISLVILYGLLFTLMVALTEHLCSAYARDPSYRAAMRVSIELAEKNMHVR